MTNLKWRVDCLPWRSKLSLPATLEVCTSYATGAPSLPLRFAPLTVGQLDGRNRREACRRAGVVPDYILLDGADPVAYILSANINRRHLSKGQRAIVVARIYPEPQRLKRKDSGSIKITELSSSYIGHARFVVRHAPDLADSILNGAISLDNAYEEARVRKGPRRGPRH